MRPCSIKLHYWLVLAGLMGLSMLLAHAYIDRNVYLQWIWHLQEFNGWYLLCLLSTVYIVSNLLVLPFGLPINLLAGMFWGTWRGGLLINVLATFIAGISFYLGRWLWQDYLQGYFKNHSYLRNITQTIERYDWQFIALARLNPIVPFGLSNYLFGAIPALSFRLYIVVTAVSNLLPCLVFASMGSVFKTLVLGDNVERIVSQFGLALLLMTVLFFIKARMSENKEST